MKMKRWMTWCCLLGVLACSPGAAPQLSIVRPAFAELTEGLDVVGVVEVAKADDPANTPIAAATLMLVNNNGSVQIPGLPSGKDLRVQIHWQVGSVPVADSTPQYVRLGAGEHSSLTFSATDYAFPDTDGDGVANLYELVFARDNPDLGGDPVTDAQVQPAGFFSEFAGAIALPGDIAFQAVARALNGLALIGTSTLSAASTPIYSEHTANIVNLTTRERRGLPLDCDDTEPVAAVATNIGGETPLAAIACGMKVHFVVVDGLLGTVLATTSVEIGNVDYLFYAKDGRRLYAVDLFHHRISVLNSGVGKATGYAVAEVIDTALLGRDAIITSLVDTGTRLILTDSATDSLVVLSHQEGAQFERVGVALAGQLAKPETVILHPQGDRVYVANLGDGSVREVDIRANDPASWRVTGTVVVANELSSLAIEPVYGNWLYAVAAHAFARIDTLTLRIDRRIDLPDGDMNLFMDVAVSEDGARGVVVAGAAGLLVLGNSVQVTTEQEPNDTVAQAFASAAVIGPPPARAVGFVDISQNPNPAVTFFANVYQGTTPVPFEEDIEDLWRLELGDTAGPVALAVVPTAGISRVSLSLVEAEGGVLDTAIYPLQATVLPVGTGVFLVIDSPADLPPGVLVGISATDFDRSANFTPYEVSIVAPGPFAEVVESESTGGAANNDRDGAQLVSLVPSVLHGVVDAADAGAYVAWGTEDVEDCYLVDVANRELGVRLDFGAQVDLDLTVHDLQGVRIPNQHAMVGLGSPEHFIFEPHLSAKNFLVCVTIEDGTTPASASYTLTFVDFET